MCDVSKENNLFYSIEAMERKSIRFLITIINSH